MKKRGFTLVEIMIVVAIIALLAAIAIPNLLRARVNANEAAAVSALKTVATASISFRSVNSSYPADLTALGSATPPYIDSVLAAGSKQGYTFSLTGATNTFTATAVPQTIGTTGNRGFYVDESGVVRFTTTGAAPTSASSTLE